MIKMKEDKESLNRFIIQVGKALEKNKDKEKIKKAYERIEALKKKRNL